MNVQDKDLIHPAICGSMTHRSRGYHVEIGDWEQCAPMNVGLSTADVHSFDDYGSNKFPVGVMID